MRRGLAFSIAGGVVLLALAGCGRSYLLQGDRDSWRHEAEETCLKSGAVKIGVVPAEPIEGPGMCGADFPLKVSALGEPPALSYAEPRPPAAIPNAGMPQWPPAQPQYAQPQYAPPPPPQVMPAGTVPGERLRWVPGPQGIDIQREGGAPAGQPMSLSPTYDAPSQPRYAPPQVQPMTPRQVAPMAAPGARAIPNDVPDDAVLPPEGSAGVRRMQQPAYNAPVYQPPPQRRELPKLGPVRGPYTGAIPAAQLQPAATLACPIVSALDRWVAQGVQPAALHWFGSPVVQIHQIGSYSCRGMVGGSGVSEHSFGNALDIAGFTLADGRKITVKDGWHGTPEQQGFLHDVQLFACETFSTVLAPGYNVYHYDHIHVDLMRRSSGNRPCRPLAIPGEVVAAKARARYAAQHRGPAYTGSIGTPAAGPAAIPGADGFVDGDGTDPAVTGSIEPEQAPPPLPSYMRQAPAEDRFTAH